MKTVAMVPARLGSQRLKKKNLREINGTSLVALAVRKCREAGCFDEIWVNSESSEIGEIAADEHALFYQRPAQFADDNATSEDFVADFFENVDCENLVQVHSIAPLLSAMEVRAFTESFLSSDCDVYLSRIDNYLEHIHCGEPVNFSLSEKTNSQNLLPVSCLSWAVSGWRKEIFLAAHSTGNCATYYGKLGTFPVSQVSGHAIKTESDLLIAQQLFGIVKQL